MTLKAALSANKKNPTLFLKRDKQFYYVPKEPYYQGTPQMAQLHEGDAWSHGFAWLHWESRVLPVSYKTLSARNWETIDGQDIFAYHEMPELMLQSLVKKHDAENKYNPDNSVFGTDIFRKANLLLKAKNSPCKVEFVPTNYQTVNWHLTAPDGTDLQERCRATKLVCELALQTDAFYDSLKEQKLFEDNKPSTEIVAKQVDMAEFLERVAKSEKLWYMDGTNARKFDRTGRMRRDWTKAILRPAKLKRSTYGGARTDRLASRNALTNFIGLPKCSGMSFYSLDDKEGLGGTFFADIVAHYGPDGEAILIDDYELLDLRHDITHKDPNPHLGFGQLTPTAPKSYYSVLKILNKRLADFESYNK